MEKAREFQKNIYFRFIAFSMIQQMEKAREFQNIYFCFIDYDKTFDCVDHNKPRKILKEMGIPDHLTCLLRNLYISQEAEHGYNWTWNNRLVPNWERNMSKLYIVTLLI